MDMVNIGYILFIYLAKPLSYSYILGAIVKILRILQHGVDIELKGAIYNNKKETNQVQFYLPLIVCL